MITLPCTEARSTSSITETEYGQHYKHVIDFLNLLVQIGDLITSLASVRVNANFHVAKCQSWPRLNETHLEYLCSKLAQATRNVADITVEMRCSNYFWSFVSHAQQMLHDRAS